MRSVKLVRLALLLMLCGLVMIPSASAQCGANGKFIGIGNAGDILCTGKTGAAGYPVTFTAQTGITVTAATHGQGTKPVGFCYDNSVPANLIPQTAGFPTVAANGDMVFAWTGSKTGYCLISGLGNQVGPAGPAGAQGPAGTNGLGAVQKTYCASGCDITLTSSPTFTVLPSGVMSFIVTLNSTPITTSALDTTNATFGQYINFTIKQDSIGSRPFPWPVNVIGWCDIETFGNAYTSQMFRWDGTNAIATAPCTVTNGPPGSAISLKGSSTGSTTVQATATASGVLTLPAPAVSDTLMGRATTDTMTGKTFDTAGAGNSLLINGLAVTSNTGTGSIVRATAPTLNPIIQNVTVSQLAGLSPSMGMEAYVTNGSTSNDCTVGGGSNKVLCVYNGSTWVATGSGGSGTVTNTGSLAGGTPICGDGATDVTKCTNTGSGNTVLATNPIISAPTIADLSNMPHTHANAAGGGQLDNTAIATANKQGSTGTKFQMFAGVAPTNGNMAVFDANGNIIDGGPPGTGGSGSLPPTVVQTGQSNTYSAGDQDFSSATSITVPKGAGAAPTADGKIAFDTTSHLLKVGVNGSTKTPEFVENKNTNSGYAGLDSNGLLSLSQVPVKAYYIGGIRAVNPHAATIYKVQVASGNTDIGTVPVGKKWAIFSYVAFNTDTVGGTNLTATWYWGMKFSGTYYQMSTTQTTTPQGFLSLNIGYIAPAGATPFINVDNGSILDLIVSIVEMDDTTPAGTYFTTLVNGDNTILSASTSPATYIYGLGTTTAGMTQQGNINIACWNFSGAARAWTFHQVPNGGSTSTTTRIRVLGSVANATTQSASAGGMLNAGDSLILNTNGTGTQYCWATTGWFQ